MAELASCPGLEGEDKTYQPVIRAIEHRHQARFTSCGTSPFEWREVQCGAVWGEEGDVVLAIECKERGLRRWLLLRLPQLPATRHLRHHPGRRAQPAQLPPLFFRRAVICLRFALGVVVLGGNIIYYS